MLDLKSLKEELDFQTKLDRSVEELLAWAGEPLATAEVLMITRLDPAEARAALSRVARAEAAGADFYWTLA